MLHIDVLFTTVAHIGFRSVGLRQLERHVVTLLGSDEIIDPLHLGSVDEGALHTHGLRAVQEKHISTSDELLGSRAVEDGLRIDTGTHLEGNSGGEVGLDITSNDRCRRTLCGNNHVYTHGTCQLGNTGNRQLYLLAGSHNQITELIDDNDDIWHETVTASGRNLTVYEFLVVLLDIPGTHLLQQVVTGIHQFAEGVQRTYHLCDVGNDWIGIIVGHLGKEVVDKRIVDGELHLLGIDEHYLQFCRVLFI